jgi:hypothetical protein
MFMPGLNKHTQNAMWQHILLIEVEVAWQYCYHSSQDKSLLKISGAAK